MASLLFLAVAVCAPVFESDRGLPVPWSLIVQGEQLWKALPRVWRVQCRPLQTLQLSHTCPSAPCQCLLAAGLGVLSAGLAAGPVRL